MKFRIASDLHLELNSSKEYPFNLPKLEDEKNTVLILAGDICVVNDLTLAIPFFNNVCKRFKHVLYVFGNHEFYRSRMNEAYGKFNNVIGKFHDNLTVSANEPKVLQIDEYKFILATLWTAWDHPPEVLHISNEFSMDYCRKSMGDFFLIKDENNRLFTPQKSKDIHKGHIEFIRENLERKDYEKSVVISHHCPSLKSIAPRFYRDPLNPAFSSNLSAFIKEYKPNLWVHGHTHHSFMYMDHETQIICNPKGYGTENQNFSPCFTIEI